MIGIAQTSPPTGSIGRAAPAEGYSPSVGVTVDAADARNDFVHIAVTALALMAIAGGVDFESGSAIYLSCAAILLLGLPHGALDMVALLSARPEVRWRAVATYLALAGLMSAIWWVLPGVALPLFFAIATVHFAEDWPGEPLIAGGGALALLAAPLLFHRQDIDLLLTIVAGTPGTTPLGNSLLLLAPVAIAAGLTACALSWSAGRQRFGASAAAAIAGMVVLPPLVGFALAFTLFHSPRHLRRGLAALAPGRAWRAPVASASAAALLLVAVIAWSTPSLSLSSGLIRGTFIALSVLTVPHMMLTPLLHWAQRSR